MATNFSEPSESILVAVEMMAAAAASTDIESPDRGGSRHSLVSRSHDSWHRRLIRSGAGTTGLIIGLDAGVTAGATMICYTVLSPDREFGGFPVIILMMGVTICQILSFSERGLYGAGQITNRQVPWWKFAGAWLQAISLGLLAASCAATLSGVFASHFDYIEGMLLGPQPAILVFGGYCALACTRSLRLSYHAGAEPRNRCAVIGADAQVNDLLVRMRAEGTGTFDVVGVVPMGAGEDMAGAATAGQFPRPPGIADLDVLEEMIGQGAVDTILLAAQWPAPEQIRTVLDRIALTQVVVYIYWSIAGLESPLLRADRRCALPLLMVYDGRKQVSRDGGLSPHLGLLRQRIRHWSTPASARWPLAGILWPWSS
jgi:hypothetical protein